MDEVLGIKSEPDLDLTDIEYNGVESEDISDVLIKQEFEYVGESHVMFLSFGGKSDFPTQIRRLEM